jgi:excisionase family DNA binding protein
MKKDSLITTEDAAEILEVSVRQIQRYIQSGRLPYERRVGRLYLLNKTIVERFEKNSPGKPKKEK